MPISRTQPLMLLDIAKFWARELQGTAQPETQDDLKTAMAAAVLTGKLKVADPLSRYVIQREIEEIERGSGDAGALPAISITRNEFLGWIAENGYRPRPTFWDCTVPSNEQLSLAQIADLWSQDTDGTPLARNSIELLAELLDAFRKGEFTVARGQDELQPSLSKWREFGNNVKLLDQSAIIQKLKLTRDEFLRWVDQNCHVRPKFWEGQPKPDSTQIDETVSSAEPQTIAAVRPSTTTSLHSEREAFRRIGRPPHDWDGTIKRRVFELMDYHGPFSADDPDWNVQARLVEKIEDEFRVSATQIRKYLPAMIEEWTSRKAGK